MSFEDQGTVYKDMISVSFPIVFEHKDDIYMTISNDGNSEAAKHLRLFKAVSFPEDWVCVDTLLTGLWKDPVIHIEKDDYYLFASSPIHDAYLFHSKSLNGPYTEHPASPIVYGDKSIGRNAGKVFLLGENMYRPVQDCSKYYGEKVRLMKIDTLSPTKYQEHEIVQSPILTGSGVGWNKRRMHTFNIYQYPDGRHGVITDGSEASKGKLKLNIRRRK